MVISIIIVNYNVKYFLEQCLCAVKKATSNIEAEIFVVDNNSSDESISYLQPRFPFVQFIHNKENIGFAKANNQVLERCKGEYILYLNPDTIVPEDCFEKCFEFFKMTADCGAIGVKMIDGSGTFLPESKRGFPSPIASFFKLTGLAELFPRSPFFNQYSLGYLNPFKNHRVDVLAGAYLMARSSIIHSINGFDEAFFMYGEDIDLSYRIQQSGFNNYYLADSTILHFKGESTKKGSLNYVKMFYSAMSIFVHKHYSGNKAHIFSLFIHTAIVLRAGISILKSFVVKVGMPLLDALIIFFTLWFVKNEWTAIVRNGLEFTLDNFPMTFFSFTVIFLVTGAVSGMYDKPDKPLKTFLASTSGIVLMIAAYALFPDRLRFSRSVVVLGGFVAAAAITIFRWILLKINWIEPSDEEYKFQQTAIVGTIEEYKRVYSIFNHAGIEERIIGRISVDENNKNSIGDIKEIKELLNKLNIKELIFCEGKLSNYLIIQLVQTLPRSINYRFIGNDSDSIVGSDSKATSGETLAAEGFYRINEAYNKRMKRVVDIFFSIYLLITFPLQILFVKGIGSMVKNCIKVLSNKFTWVGYTIKEIKLPTLKKSIITCYGLPVRTVHPLNKEALHHLNLQYAKNYDFWIDIKILFKNYKQLGKE